MNLYKVIAFSVLVIWKYDIGHFDLIVSLFVFSFPPNCSVIFFFLPSLIVSLFCFFLALSFSSLHHSIIPPFLPAFLLSSFPSYFFLLNPLPSPILFPSFSIYFFFPPLLPNFLSPYFFYSLISPLPPFSYFFLSSPPHFYLSILHFFPPLLPYYILSYFSSLISPLFLPSYFPYFSSPTQFLLSSFYPPHPTSFCPLSILPVSILPSSLPPFLYFSLPVFLSSILFCCLLGFSVNIFKMLPLLVIWSLVHT